MRKITKENIDTFYEKINSLIEKYFERNISPISLFNYFKKGGKGMSNFIKRNELSDVVGIDRIIHDVVSDRKGEVEDIMTFESYVGERNKPVFSGLNQSNIGYEKVLADLYRVSISDILEVDTFEHSYKVKNKEVIIFSKEDLDIVTNNLVDVIYEKLEDSTIYIPYFNFNVKLDTLIIKDNIKDKIENNIELVSESLTNYEYSTTYNEYYIWIKNGKESKS
jgi:hypothetical protein